MSMLSLALRGFREELENDLRGCQCGRYGVDVGADVYRPAMNAILEKIKNSGDIALLELMLDAVEKHAAAEASREEEFRPYWEEQKAKRLAQEEAERLDQERALTVDCPYCGVPAGKKCIFDTGKHKGEERIEAHRDRIRQFHGLTPTGLGKKNQWNSSRATQLAAGQAQHDRLTEKEARIRANDG